MDGIIEFDLIKNQASNIIKVIGVGGGGGNAVKNMYSQGIKDVSFAICNTDSQALSRSNVPTKIQLGDTGLGAGGNPEKGRAAAETSIEQIKALFNDTTQMVFITAGMGGGTGTGAAPIIAHIAKEMGILTIGIVTIPFQFEMKPKIVKAIKGVNEMKENVDALLVINNERLREIYADGITTAKEAFCKADDILTTATKSIAEIITIEGTINRDFCDVETIMKDGGSAIMAMGRAKGKYRIQNAILDALNSPLLNDNDIEKAQKQLLPTELGKIVNKLLTENFSDIVNVEFTAKIENEFDEIAEGKEKWKKIIREFYGPFKEELEKAEKELEHVQLVDEVSDVQCEKCGRMMVYKYGRYGKFLACPGFPECRNVKPIIETIDVPCPKCGATVQVRKTKRKRNYYICENNPASCDYISWNKPKPGEKWNPEEAEEVKKETEKKPKSTKKASTKRKTTTKKSKK